MQMDTKIQWDSTITLEEIDSLLKNQTQDLCKFPIGKRSLSNKWAYRFKEEDRCKKIFKAKLVVKGFAQKKGIDFDEIFSHVVNKTSIHIVLSIVATKYFHLEKLDATIVFLHGDLDEEIYIAQPQGLRSKVRRTQCAN